MKYTLYAVGLMLMSGCACCNKNCAECEYCYNGDCETLPDWCAHGTAYIDCQCLCATGWSGPRCDQSTNMLSGTIRHDASQTGGAHVEDFLSTTPTRQAFGDSVRLSGSDAGYRLHLIPFVQPFQTGTFEIPTTASARISFGLNTYEAYAGTVTVTTNGYDASLLTTVIKGTFDIPFYDHVTAGQFYNIDDGEFTILY